MKCKCHLQLYILYTDVDISGFMVVNMIYFMFSVDGHSPLPYFVLCFF